MRRDSSFSLLLLCFFLSGVAGLVYETAWTREFAFVFGTSNLAVATVLFEVLANAVPGSTSLSLFQVGNGFSDNAGAPIDVRRMRVGGRR